MNKYKFLLKQLKTLVLIYVFKILSVFSKNQHWVLCERGADARDNAYHLYKYIKANHPERKIYYIIDKHSADCEKVKQDAIHFGSIKNYWAVASAEKIISSHYGLSIPFVGKKVFHLCGLYKKYYFLQHGVTKDQIKGLFQENAPMELFICGAKPEYNFVLERFGHSQKVVQYTGLARYDNLHDAKVKNQILIMPTWRYYIHNEEEFKKSEYFAKWQKVLLDDNLIQRLEQENTKLIFYVHYEMQKYLHCFKSKSNNVILAAFHDYDVQTLLKESAVLVTDYSSVFFDFAYMKKPMVFFQFDHDRFFSEHYEKGYFDYKKMGFGKVCEKSEDLINHILDLFDNKFQLESVYEKRIQGFFPLHDKKNCERIYNAIMER